MKKKPFMICVIITMLLLPLFFGIVSHAEVKAYAESLSLREHTDEAFVTPEMFGAAGDGIKDDTKALQAAIDSGLPVVLLPGNYLTSETIVISGQISIVDLGSTITYTGTDSAVRFTNVNNQCDVSLGIINAYNGNGIEFYCNSNTTRCQYVNLRFNIISAGNYGICFNRDGLGSTHESGWLNEIRISDGRFVRGKYGIYADARGRGGINNVKTVNLAFEGVDTGACMANGCRGWSFINTRISETNKDDRVAFQTVGKMEGLLIVLPDQIREERMRFSEQTQGTIVAPIMGTDYTGKSAVVGGLGEIINGVIYPLDQSMASLALYSAIDPGTDLNDITAPGNYSCPQASGTRKLRHCPTSSAFTMTVRYADGTPDYIAQELWEYGSNIAYRRTYDTAAGTFSEWQRNANEDDLVALQEEIAELREALYGFLRK